MKAASSSINIDKLHPDLKEMASEIEDIIGEELIITSGFRDKTHPIEARKSKPGTHYGDGNFGYAIDCAAVGGTATHRLVAAAIKVGFKRIGISRKSNFVHLDIDKERPTSIWTY